MSETAAVPETVREPRNALGLTALILGLVGLLFGLIPLVGFIAVILGIIGVALGLAGLGRVKRKRATNLKTTWAGVIASVASLVLGIWGMTIVFGAVEQLDKDMSKLDREITRDLNKN